MHHVRTERAGESCSFRGSLPLWSQGEGKKPGEGQGGGPQQVHQDSSLGAARGCSGVALAARRQRPGNERCSCVRRVGPGPPEGSSRGSGGRSGGGGGGGRVGVDGGVRYREKGRRRHSAAGFSGESFDNNRRRSSSSSSSRTAPKRRGPRVGGGGALLSRAAAKTFRHATTPAGRRSSRRLLASSCYKTPGFVAPRPLAGGAGGANDGHGRRQSTAVVGEGWRGLRTSAPVARYSVAQGAGAGDNERPGASDFVGG
ncbi:unnamed protein product, partial [Ectocarpus sp. 8 AP-2014]